MSKELMVLDPRDALSLEENTNHFNLRSLGERVLALVDHEDGFLHYGVIDLLLKRGCFVFERTSSTPITIGEQPVSPDLIIVGDLEDWPKNRTRPLREMYPKAKFVVYGSDSDPVDIELELVRSRGFDGYIPDNVSEPQLVSLLQQLLAGKCALPQATPSLRRGSGATPAKTSPNTLHAS